MAVCQVCQRDNPPGVEYCEDCGAALAAAGEKATVQSAAPAAPPAATPAAGSPPASPSTDSAAAASPPATGDAAAPFTGSPPEATASAASAPSAAPPPASPGSASAPPAAPGQGARLVAMRFGAPSGEEIPLLGQRLLVGRFDPETGPVDVDLSAGGESAHISRQHGELYREADGPWTVRDLGSTNGIFVKGSADAAFGPRITAPRPLTNGDELAFGNTRYVFKTD